jgi:hypothetical protein
MQRVRTAPDEEAAMIQDRAAAKPAAAAIVTSRV